MSELPVVVVGAGFAGVAAVSAATRAGARVLVVHAAAGASSLYSGIADGAAPSLELLDVARALGLEVGAAARAVASREGAVRRAHGRDAALLDLEPLAGRQISVADFGRDDWDARLVAASLAASAWAVESGTRFVCTRVHALLDTAERRIPAYDLALRLDTGARLDALAAALLSAAPDAQAWLTGPYLGVGRDVAAELRARLGVPVGETSSAPGGVAGARFDQRRDALFAELGVEVHRARVLALRSEPGALVLELDVGKPLRARAVVLATGGVAGGGIELAATAQGGWGFRLSLSAPVALELDAEACDAGSSLYGVSFERRGLGALERVGIVTSGGTRATTDSSIFAAGDARSASPGNVLAALSSGAEAGRGAATGSG